MPSVRQCTAGIVSAPSIFSATLPNKLRACLTVPCLSCELAAMSSLSERISQVFDGLGTATGSAGPTWQPSEQQVRYV